MCVSVRARSLSLFVPEMFRSRPLLIFLLLLKIRALSHTEVSERNIALSLSLVPLRTSLNNAGWW